MVYRDATLSLSYFERYVVCHKCHHLSNDLCANVISPGFLKSFLTIPYFWDLKLYRNTSWLPNQMISLVLIFGFLCRSSISRYPDDLRNIVQQCASWSATMSLLCEQPAMVDRPCPREFVTVQEQNGVKLIHRGCSSEQESIFQERILSDPIIIH